MQLKTENCIVCGKTAKMWHGHVLVNDGATKVIAGFCNNHSRILCSGLDASYGYYNSKLMGTCISCEK